MPVQQQGAFVGRRGELAVLERKLEHGDYSLRDLQAAVVELDEHELANVNTTADLAALTG